MKPPRSRKRPAISRQLDRFFRRPQVELSVGLLIIVSIGLTLLEFLLSAADSKKPAELLDEVQLTNDVITMVFVIELLLRFVATWSPRRYVREYWIDLIATLPSLLPGFFAARVMRLFRLLRILRLFGYVSRLSTNYPYILRKGLVEYIFVCGLLVLTVLLGTSAMMLFEARNGMSFGEAFWFSLHSLFAGEPIPEAPQSVGGRVVAVVVMFMGLTIFAMFTGTVSAFMVERLRLRGKSVESEQLENHVVICGWNTKAAIIIEECRASHLGSDTPIVVVSQWEHEAPSVSANLQSQVFFVNEDFTRVSTLERVGIHHAKMCIILNDTSGGRNEQDADARTILAALTAEKLNPDVYTCAELNNRDYASHLKMGKVNDYVVSSEHSAYMMAQAALNRGMMDVFNELLTHQHGNQFYRIPVPEQLVGREFDEVLSELRQSHGALLIAVGKGHEMSVNPIGHVLAADEEIVVISQKVPFPERVSTG
ncbi:MAG: ion transporter [Planctomycetota bacterium]